MPMVLGVWAVVDSLGEKLNSKLKQNLFGIKLHIAIFIANITNIKHKLQHIWRLLHWKEEMSKMPSIRVKYLPPTTL